MNTVPWFERKHSFGMPKELLPYYLERLEGTIVRMEKKVLHVDEAILAKKLNGKWSVKQHIGHLAEVDEVANKRIAEVITGMTTMSPAVFEPKDYNPWPIERVVNYFTFTRMENLHAYRATREEDLLKSSIHPRLKVPMTLIDLAWFDAEHDDHHLVKINEIIFTLTKT